ILMRCRAELPDEVLPWQNLIREFGPTTHEDRLLRHAFQGEAPDASDGIPVQLQASGGRARDRVEGSRPPAVEATATIPRGEYRRRRILCEEEIGQAVPLEL